MISDPSNLRSTRRRGRSETLWIWRGLHVVHKIPFYTWEWAVEIKSCLLNSLLRWSQKMYQLFFSPNLRYPNLMLASPKSTSCRWWKHSKTISGSKIRMSASSDMTPSYMNKNISSKTTTNSRYKKTITKQTSTWINIKPKIGRCLLCLMMHCSIKPPF